MHPRVLAIDLRSRLFGFAVLEGPRALLSFGRTIFPVGSAQNNGVVVRRKIDRLLTFFVPSVIAVKHTAGRRDLELLTRKDAIAVIKERAERRSVELVLLNRQEIYQAFRQSGNMSKYEIARLISEVFPELRWKLPPNRKTWQPEHHNMPIFDSISVGLAYFAQVDQPRAILDAN
jgi:hypothetical protein